MSKKIHSDDDRPIDDGEMDEENSSEGRTIDLGSQAFARTNTAVMEEFNYLHGEVLRTRCNSTSAEYSRFVSGAASEGLERGDANAEQDEENWGSVTSDASTIGPKDARLLAQIYGHRDELPNLDAYLISAVEYCRDQVPLPEPGSDDEEISIADTKDTVTVVASDTGLAYAVGDEPLSEDEEAIYKERIMDAQDRSDEPKKAAPMLKMLAAAGGIDIDEIVRQVQAENTQFDVVNKSKHYNLHPSGVECIELAEKMSFNLGNAFKYVFRRNDKASSLLDLRKAEYYLKREIERLTQLHKTLPSSIIMVLHPMMTVADDGKIDAIMKCEPDSMARNFYAYLLPNPLLDNGLYNLSQAREALAALITRAEREQQC